MRSGVFPGSTSRQLPVRFSTRVVADTQGPDSRLVLTPFTLK